MIPLLGVTLELASKFQCISLFLPFNLCFCFFILSNQNTFNIACGYMDRLTKRLWKKQKWISLYTDVCRECMAEWKFNISKQFGYSCLIRITYGIASAAVVLPIYGLALSKPTISISEPLLLVRRWICYRIYFPLVVLVYSGVMYQQIQRLSPTNNRENVQWTGLQKVARQYRSQTLSIIYMVEWYFDTWNREMKEVFVFKK